MVKRWTWLYYGNGDIILAGEIWNFAMEHDFGLAKYKSDGSLDATFGNGGKITHGGMEDQGCTSVCIQNDGKIVAVGYDYNGMTSKFMVTDQKGKSGPLIVNGHIRWRKKFQIDL